MRSPNPTPPAWKKRVMRLLFPPAAVVALLALASAAALIHGFLSLPEHDWRRIASYVLSFYALLILCLRIPAMLARIRSFRQENRFYLRYRSDVRLRMNLSLWTACICNAAYAALQLALGISHRSAWFYAMAGYYCLLAMLRLMLGSHVRAYAPGDRMRSEWRKYRLCGAGLLAMNLALTVFSLYFVLHLRELRHHEITVIAMSAYTFGALALAIVNVIRYRCYESPACSAAKALSLASAAVSMLSLEDAMLTTFGDAAQQPFRQIMLAASAAAVAALIIAMALYMIFRATASLKALPGASPKKTKDRSKAI